MSSHQQPPVAHAGPVVVVVGGSSGIGLATARQLQERGNRVVLAARSAERLVDVAAALPGHPLTVATDVTDPDSVAALVATVLEAHGRIDAVVLTAQVMAYGSVEQVPEEVFDVVVDTAVKGAFHVARAVLPVFRRQGGGALVVVSSLLAEIAVPSMSSYCTAKWGQLGLVRSLQLEVRGDRGVSVSLVLPGAIDTPIYEQAAGYAGKPGSAPPPVISPERVARACVSAIERPRRMVHVGPVNLLAVLGFRGAPFVYDAMAGPLVRFVVLRGPDRPDSSGNVLEPRPAGEGERGGWTVTGRLRTRGGRPRWRRRRDDAA